MSLDFKILSIDCATLSGGAAILSHQGILAEQIVRTPTSHSVRILETVKNLLNATEIELKDLTAIAVASGPGSFTGVRVGISVAKSLAYASNLPLIGVSTLEALAHRYYREDYLICPMIDARRSEVYAAGYEFKDDYAEEIIQPTVAPVEKILDQIQSKTIFLGDGSIKYQADIIARLGTLATFPPIDKILPTPSAIAFLGWRKYKSGESGNPIELKPLYLRDADAKPPAFMQKS